jgi:hypothetical protein
MAYLHRALKTPSILRALADVAEQFPHLNADFSAGAELDLLRTIDANKPSIAVSFSCDLLAMETDFRIALGQAYRRYGGDPSAFLPSDAPPADRLPELRGRFERILEVARYSGGRTVGNIELAGLLIRAVETWQRESQP